MSEHRAFVEKYRPRKLSSVVGQDVAVGLIRGMLKSGRVSPTMMISGPFGCLAGDSIIGINRGGKSFKLPIKDVVARFNGEPILGKVWDSSIPTFVRSRMKSGHVRLHKLVSAQSSGVKKVYKIKTKNGFWLKATLDHEFLTRFGWRELGQIKIGDSVCVEIGRARISLPTSKKVRYEYVPGLKHHPYCRKNHVVDKHKLVMEASLNGLSFGKFVNLIKLGKTSGLKFIDSKKFQVHHLDENPFNNKLANLAILTIQEHQVEHDRWKQVLSRTSFVEVVSISECGSEMTYDLTMDGEPRNFLANKIVVHNCGKTTLARIIARYVNCQDKKGADECEGCSSCDAFRSGNHPNIHEIDAGSMRSIDNIRDLQRVAPLAPQYNKRVFIIDEAQGLSPDAFRAALKLLEEPPKHTMFILSTNEPQKLPPTIQDRCFHIELKEPQMEVVAKYVKRISTKEGLDFPRETCEKVARAANGHIRSAVRLLEQVIVYAQAHSGKTDDVSSELPQIIQKVLGLPSEQTVVTYVRAVIKKDLPKALGIVAYVKEQGLDPCYFLSLVISSIRNHLFGAMAPKLLDGRYYKIVKEVDSDLKKWKKSELISLLSLYISAFERMKQRVVPERETLDLVTFSSFSMKEEKE